MAIRQITSDEAHKLLGLGYRYIDVRTEPEFAAGHPASAVNIPVIVPNPATGQMTVNSDFLSVVEAHFPKDAQIVVGCQSGMRAQRAAEILAQVGYATIANMQDGFAGWSKSGLPTCKDCGPDTSYAGLRKRAT